MINQHNFRYLLFKIQPKPVWSDPLLQENLSWYYGVLRELKPAKYLICKSNKTELDLKNTSFVNGYEKSKTNVTYRGWVSNPRPPDYEYCPLCGLAL